MTAACDSRQLSEDDWHCVANVYDGTAINAYVGVLYGVTLYAIAPHAGRSTQAAPHGPLHAVVANNLLILILMGWVLNIPKVCQQQPHLQPSWRQPC